MSNPPIIKNISVGWDGSPEGLDVFLTWKERISDVYFAAPGAPTGRNSRFERSPCHATKTEGFVKELTRHGLRSNLLLNGMCQGELTGTSRWTKFVRDTLEHFAKLGLTDVTCSSVEDMATIKRHFPELTVHSSVNMFVDSVAKCAQVMDFADVINLDRSINYDFERICEIRDFARHKTLKILVNEGCLYQCIHRIHHFNALSHNTNLPRPYCERYFISKPQTVLYTPIIRPEDLFHYFGIINVYKLATRHVASVEHLQLILKAYIEEDYNGNLFDLISSDGLAAAQENVGKFYIDNKSIPFDYFVHRAETKGQWIPETSKKDA